MIFPSYCTRLDVSMEPLNPIGLNVMNNTIAASIDLAMQI